MSRVFIALGVWAKGTVPFHSICQSHVTGLPNSTKCHACPMSHLPGDESIWQKCHKILQNWPFPDENHHKIFQCHAAPPRLTKPKVRTAGHMSHGVTDWMKWYSIWEVMACSAFWTLNFFVSPMLLVLTNIIFTGKCMVYPIMIPSQTSLQNFVMVVCSISMVIS